MRFFVSDVESGARASKFARFLPKTGSTRLPCSEFRFLPRKACEFQPAELVAACHRFVAARFLGAKVRKTGPSSPLHQAPFFGAKSAPNGRVRRVRFSCRTASGMPKPPNSQVFGGKRAPDDHFVQFPLTACHRFVTALFGAEKCAMEKRVCVVAREFELRDIFPQSINLETPRVCKTWLILPIVICLSQSRS